MKVAIYVRETGTRQYKPASPRALYPANVTFCLRYTLGGKRTWEQLSVSTYKEAQAESLRRLPRRAQSPSRNQPPRLVS